jgi:hypothetical protein
MKIDPELERRVVALLERMEREREQRREALEATRLGSGARAVKRTRESDDTTR